ncbi:hypothetical protein P3X46_025087 [Hevea brasiliensis]|uniref:NB-ARC domain-containing protein n=1 Tax=Hevea brasiliensis TaxID=3981 RepID=A0ABQ9L7V2_HEVBR|nr:hypothetical protein P3X46_025087 [Hevea brasiliensis]
MEIDVIKELENAESRTSKKRKNEVAIWLNNVGRVKNDIETMKQEAGPGLQRILFGKLVEEKTEEDKLERPLSPDLMEIAKSIARECAGLPLGIITIAASMRGADDICEWRNALRELQESQAREVKGEEVAPLRKLETLKCHFYDVVSAMEKMPRISQKMSNTCTLNAATSKEASYA